MPINDTSWKPGQSGNPGGRRLDTIISDHIRRRLRDEIPVDREGNPILGRAAQRKHRNAERRKIGHVLADMEIRRALEGDPAAFGTILNRLEGKPVQAVDQTKRDETSEAFVEFLRSANAWRVAHTPPLLYPS